MLSAIIVAAGSSRRVGFDKLFTPIAGKPVIAHTIAAFERSPSVNQIIIVAREDRHAAIQEIVRDEKFRKVCAVVAGGEHRQDSVQAGLQSLGKDARYVAVHDAARPLVTSDQIELVFAKCREVGAATLAEPISDTIKRAGSDMVVSDSVDRSRLYAMQTPQIFERALLDEGYRAVAAKKSAVTDEVSVAEQLGRKIALVVSDQLNFKITFARDLPLADFVLRQRGANG
jgi:2-C-methyl-D-erythritol 4-phosphate cytidylyltransferase